MIDDVGGSHVNRIPSITLDDLGYIHTVYGSYHPVTEEGLPIDAFALARTVNCYLHLRFCIRNRRLFGGTSCSLSGISRSLSV